jgi:oxygen-independent coproporphyrinogen-3 oxidase
MASFEEIFAALHTTFNLQPEAEISLEANPGTLSLDYLRGLHYIGFNRISLGMQSARPDELRLLERQHDVPDVIRAVKWARQAGFDNLNLDLIYGLPHQTLDDWQRSLAVAVDLAPQHLSLYALTVEEGTPLHTWVSRGLLESVDPDLAADMYELASEKLAGAGFLQYEISNWAKNSPNHPILQSSNPYFACRHNLQYWRNLPYLGLGAGAHGYFGGQRTANVLHPTAYITHLENLQPAANNLPRFPAAETVNTIHRAAEMAETMIMSLRLTREGVSRTVFTQRFSDELTACYGPAIRRLIHLGLLEWAGPSENVLRLTSRGRLLGNQVFMEFLE